MGAEANGVAPQSLPAGEALWRFRQESGLDCGSDNAASWRVGIGPATLRLPNFKWRQQAIARHDLHHLLTGIPCTMRGEFQMAAWEFAAGRLRHLPATAFCLPLVAAGLLCMPRAILRAYRDGRGSLTLYDTVPDDSLLALPLAELRCLSRRPETPGAISLALGFLALSAWAMATIALPLVAIVGAVGWLW